MPDEETKSLGHNHRLLHAPDIGAIKYQSKRPPGDWHTQANLEYREAEAVGEFIAELRERHDIEQWLDGRDLEPVGGDKSRDSGSLELGPSVVVPLEPIATCPHCDAPLANRDSPWAEYVYACTGDCPVITVDIREVVDGDD